MTTCCGRRTVERQTAPYDPEGPPLDAVEVPAEDGVWLVIYDPQGDGPPDVAFIPAWCDEAGQ